MKDMIRSLVLLKLFKPFTLSPILIVNCIWDKVPPAVHGVLQVTEEFPDHRGTKL